MPKVVPSQVVAVIDTIAAADSGLSRQDPVLRLSLHRSTHLSTILALVRRIPDELLPIEAMAYTEFVCALAAIETAFDKSQSSSLSDNGRGSILLKPLPGSTLNPVFVLRDVLEKSPDAFPSDKASNLLFIEPDYRDVLRLDLSSVNQALSQGEWKAATVLAGSLVEAFLLWGIKQKPQADVRKTITKLVANELIRKPPSDVHKWDLAQCVEVALELSIVVDATAKQVRLAKDFRNLIHPGRSIRTQQVCNRGTALSAAAAVEFVVADLERPFLPAP